MSGSNKVAGYQVNIQTSITYVWAMNTWNLCEKHNRIYISTHTCPEHEILTHESNKIRTRSV